MSEKRSGRDRRQPADEVVRPQCAGTVRLHLRNRHRQHDQLPVKMVQRQHLHHFEGKTLQASQSDFESDHRAFL